MIGTYLIQKCAKKVEENVSLILQKLSDPSSIVNINASGALADAAKGGMGSLYSFGKSYVAKNADAIILGAAKAANAKEFNKVMQAYDLAMSLLAAAVMANNELVIKMMKEVAWSLMKELAKKDEILLDVAGKLKELYVALNSLIGTHSVWDEYYADLRKALELVATSRNDVKLVRNTFQKTDFWLAKKFEGTVTKLEEAKLLITPHENNPAIKKIVDGSYKVKESYSTGQPDKTKPKSDVAAQLSKKGSLLKAGSKDMEKGLAFFGAGLSDQFPFPTTSQQVEACTAINVLSGQILDAFKGYGESATKVDALVYAFISGVNQISTGLPKLFKKYIIGLLDENYKRLDVLTRSIAVTMNGSETAISAPILGYKPNSLSVSTMSFKWIMDINIIFASYKLIPIKQLNAISLSQQSAIAYKEAVAKLKAMDGMRSGLAYLRMTDGQETTGDLELQIVALLIESNNAIISGSIRSGILAVCRTALSRLELSMVADHNIYVLMNNFYNTPSQYEDYLEQTYNGILSMFSNAGLDRALGFLVTGDFSKLFNLNGRDATYVGAALSAIGLVKKCLTTQPERDKAAEIEAELNADMDLLNISFSINFDLAIFKNLSECLRLNATAGEFNLQEFICGLIQDANNLNLAQTTKQFNKLKDLFTFG